MKLSPQNIWTNNQSSNLVGIFKLALRFRKTEQWEWIDQPSKAGLWVLDISTLSTENLARIEKGYKLMSNKPKVAVVTTFSQKVSDLSPTWKTFSSPFSVDSILHWLEEKDTTDADNLKPQVKAIPENDQKHNRLAKPWREQAFKLTSWPNISQFGSKVQTTITCSNLLSDYHDFKSAQKWGMTPELLDELLNNANENQLLKLKPNISSKINAMFEQDHKTAVDEKYKALVKKLTKWLK